MFEGVDNIEIPSLYVAMQLQHRDPVRLQLIVASAGGTAAPRAATSVRFVGRISSGSLLISQLHFERKNVAEQQSNKKIVRAPKRDRGAADGGADKPTWRATDEAKRWARNLRIWAIVCWVIAIGLEAFAIFGLLNSNSRAHIGVAFGWDTGDEGFPGWALVFLIVLVVAIGALAVTGSLLWKRANRLDPASKRDPVRFFIQNQLGAIITVVAFLPLVVLVFLNKDMDQKQKSIAGVIGVVVMAIAVLIGIDWNPPSIEQRTAEAQWDQQRVIAMTGKDEVYWVEGGEVYHLCAEVSPLQKTSTAEEIVVGTVQDAIDAGKSRLTKQVQMEINQCGLPQPDDVYLDWEPPANVEELINDGVDSTEPAPTVPAT